MPIRLAVLGATGKMGQRIIHLASKNPAFHLSTTNAGHTDALTGCDIAIDFTFHEATKTHLEAAIQTNIPLVIGTTGHTPQEVREIEAAAQKIPILFSPNFSLGIALCLQAVAHFSRSVGENTVVNLIETHHVHKKDAPSGTALMLASAVERETPHKVTIQSIRQGNVVGEHTVIFEWGHERIELKHTAHSRDAFAQGALLGAQFLVDKPPGLYSLQDMSHQVKKNFFTTENTEITEEKSNFKSTHVPF